MNQNSSNGDVLKEQLRQFPAYIHLMNNPRLLLLDEPTEGLAPMIVDIITNLISKIHEEVTRHDGSWART